jgi:hypothetical protein
LSTTNPTITVKIKLRAPVVRSLERAAKLQSNPNWRDIASEAIECWIADFELSKIPENYLAIKAEDCLSGRATDTRIDVHRSKLNPSLIQKIIHYYQSDEQPGIEQLAKRFSVGTTTIRRIIGTFNEREHGQAFKRKSTDKSAWMSSFYLPGQR